MNYRKRHDDSGSVLIWTVLVITILSLAAAELLHIISSKYNATLHTATWQESLLGAESGVDLALRELRKSLFPGANQAWQNWTTTPGDGVTSYGLATIPNAGLAGTEMRIKVNVDAPAQLKEPSNGWQHYRIRAIGTMPITGVPRASDNKQDTLLRKFSLLRERFAGTALASNIFDGPQASRRVEAVVRPKSAFDQAIVSVGALNLLNHNIIIDSYDSRDASKSTVDPKGQDGILGTADDGKGPGLYDLAKRQRNGHIATNGTVLNAGNAYVYGDVSTNSGTVSGVTNVTGVQRNDFYQEPIPVGAPSWYGTSSINPSPSTASGNTTIAANATQGSISSRYVLSAINLDGNQRLDLTGAADGSRTFVEIYVTGDITAVGLSEIVVHPGVEAIIYFAGNVNVQGNGIVNKNNKPGNLLMYGITPTDTTVTKTVQLGGNGLLSAAVYAPDYAVTINNGGTKGSVFGSFVGKSVTMDGVTDLHYDEALASGGRITDYKIVSWFEDTR